MGTGNKIKTILKEQGKTIKQLASETGISINTLYSITKRDSVSVTYPILKKIADTLHLSVYDLLPEPSKDYVTEVLEVVRQNHPESDLNEVETRIVESIIEDMPYESWWAAESAADNLLVEGMKEFSEGYLKKQLLDAFSVLSRRGKIEAVLRVEELSENRRFNVPLE